METIEAGRNRETEGVLMRELIRQSETNEKEKTKPYLQK